MKINALVAGVCRLLCFTACRLFLTLGVFCSVTASGYCQQPPGATRPVPHGGPTPLYPSGLRLSDMATANPGRDLARAVACGDLRFIGVNGFSLMIPGIAGGAWSRIVQIKGVNDVAGTSDGITGAEQGRLQSLAHRYARLYNALLLNHLQCGPDPDVVRVRQEMEAELTRMERGSPADAARKTVQEGDSRLLAVSRGDGHVAEPGLTSGQSAEQPLRVLAFCPDLATEEQARRMRELLVSYVAAYNRFVYKAVPRRHFS